MRAALYSGLSQVLSADPRCHELLSELLLPHLERYAAPGDALPPLLLDKCAAIHQVGADPTLLEPLPALLSCVRRLAALQPADGHAPPDGSSDTGFASGSLITSSSSQPAPLRVEAGCESSRALQRLLGGLRARLLECDAEHFGLDRSAELHPGTPVGQLNQVGVEFVCGGWGRTSCAALATPNDAPNDTLQPSFATADARLQPAGRPGGGHGGRGRRLPAHQPGGAPQRPRRRRGGAARRARRGALRAAAVGRVCAAPAAV